MKEANREVLDQGSLPAMLANRARHATDSRLAVDAAVGLVIAAAAAILRPPLWVPLASLAACLGFFGAWGILDREAADATHAERSRQLLSTARGIVAALGGAAALAFGASLFVKLVGPWIS